MNKNWCYTFILLYYVEVAAVPEYFANIHLAVGHFANRHFADRTFCRQKFRRQTSRQRTFRRQPKHFADKTFCRQTIHRQTTCRQTNCRQRLLRFRLYYSQCLTGRIRRIHKLRVSFLISLSSEKFLATTCPRYLKHSTYSNLLPAK